MKKHTDEQFIRQLRDGNNDAYRRIYEQYYVSLCSLAYTLVHDRFISETIVNDTIFHLWEIRKEASMEPSVRSYLMRAVHNRALNYLAANGSTALIQFYESPVETQETVTATCTVTPASRLIEEDLRKEILEALRQVPPASRAVFLLKRNKNFSYQELSNHFGISVNTVKYHLKTAMAVLRRCLGDYL